MRFTGVNEAKPGLDIKVKQGSVLPHGCHDDQPQRLARQIVPKFILSLATKDALKFHAVIHLIARGPAVGERFNA